MTDGIGPLGRVNLMELPLTEVVAHDGRGIIHFCRLASRRDRGHSGPGYSIDSACNFIDYSVIPAGASIGPHTHGPDQEEFYLVLRGRGRMTCNGVSFDVASGDLVRNPPRGTHSLENTGPEDLSLFVFEVEV
jgi:mannose-6-phosphate isomerase-like protein (cupin superfamily)